MSEAEISVVIVVAAARNGVIGRDGAMPWRLPTDLKHFKALTLGKPVVMGRKTFESLGRPLPGRANIVVSRQADYAPDGVDVAPDLDTALTLAAERARAALVTEICVIGGGTIYAQALAKADRIELTRVEAEIEGDTVFPAIDETQFERIAAQPLPRGEKDSHAMTIETYTRHAPATPRG